MGLTDHDVRELNGEEVRQHVNVPGTLLGAFNPHGARIDPARLTRGLADACVRLGVQILEQTAAVSIGPRQVVCRTGVISAEHVVRATEAYTVELRKQSRRYLPLYSLMVATEPLSEKVWAEIGWRDGLLVRDSRHLFFYAQRTPDGRIAMGGRGAPYAFGSPIAAGSERNDEVRKRLVRALVRHFPAAEEAEITHHWGGPLAVPRDWSMSVDYDKASGFGTAGGYSGHGVVASNISGRTMAHLVTGIPSEITTLPWVGHQSRRWEPEPLRFLASRAIVRVLERADRVEDTTQQRARSQLLVRPFMPGH
jgi:glycine/D-amino acid oxidase-like deaminating enzyme